MAENFPRLNKETDIQIKEADRVPNKINRKGLTPIYIIIKISEVNFNIQCKEIMIYLKTIHALEMNGLRV